MKLQRKSTKNEFIEKMREEMEESIQDSYA